MGIADGPPAAVPVMGAVVDPGVAAPVANAIADPNVTGECLISKAGKVTAIIDPSYSGAPVEVGALSCITGH